MDTKDREALRTARNCILGIRTSCQRDILKFQQPALLNALLSVTFQHTDSILLLIESESHAASAEALLRPTFEAFLKLHWVTEKEQIDRADHVAAGRVKFPGYGDLIKVITESSPSAPNEELRIMHGLTHVGMEQLVAFFTQEQDGAVIRDDNVGLVTFLCVAVAWLAYALLCRRTQNTPGLILETEKVMSFVTAFAPVEMRTHLKILASQHPLVAGLF